MNDVLNHPKCGADWFMLRLAVTSALKQVQRTADLARRA